MVLKIESMNQATQPPHESCTSCGGKGWKLLALRRSAARAGDAGEATPQRRQRVKCLHCQDETPIAPGQQCSTES